MRRGSYIFMEKRGRPERQQARQRVGSRYLSKLCHVCVGICSRKKERERGRIRMSWCAVQVFGCSEVKDTFASDIFLGLVA